MRALAMSMALLFGSTAMAGSELQLKSSMPVVLVIDGESLGTVQPLEPLLVDIEAGVRNVQLRGVLGKTLYERDLIFDDHTRTELVWQRKELRLGAVVKLDPNRPVDPAGEGDLGYEPAEELASAEPDAVEEAAVATAPVEEAAPPPPSPPAGGPPLERPSAPIARVATAPPVPEAAPPAPAPAKEMRVREAPRSTGGSVVIEAQPGMDLQITHGSQRLRVTVENGELVVEDANGTEIHFPAGGEVF